MSVPRNPPCPAYDPDWPSERLTEARSVVADIAHHSDALARIACKVLIQHGRDAGEREEARLLLVILDARSPVRRSSQGGPRHEP